MAKSVIGVYRSSADAQKAVNGLLNAGFTRNQIQVKGGTGQQVQASGGMGRSLMEESGINDFFRSLVGQNDENNRAQTYAHAVSQGHAVVTLNADNDYQANRASDIMDRCNPIDIDDYASSMRQTQQGMGAQQGQAVGQQSQTMQQQPRMSAQQGQTMGQQQALSGISPGSVENVVGEPYDDVQENRAGGPQQRLMGQEGIGPQQGQMQGRPAQMQVQQGQTSGQQDQMLGQQQAFSGMSDGSIENIVGEPYDDVQENRPGGPQQQLMAQEGATDMQQGRVTGQMRQQGQPLGQQTQKPGQQAGYSGVSPGSVENAVGEPYDDIQENRPGGQRPGVQTYQRSPEMASGGRQYDDTPFRTHWQSNYGASGGSYSDYEPAYRYGSSLAGNERWRGRKWEDVETDVRRDWESRNQQGTWDKFKGSIRYAWESMTGKTSDTGRTAATAGGAGVVDRGRTTARPSDAGRHPVDLSGGAHVPDDTEFRAHWQHSYWVSGGGYDDYAPAYRYGADYADNDTNPNHQWADVEEHLRNDWLTYNREDNTWEKNKEAIRYGWEKGKQRAKGTHSGESLRR